MASSIPLLLKENVVFTIGHSTRTLNDFITLPENLSKAGIGYMQTQEFEKNLDELMRISSSTRLALLCAEAVPWRCHRS